MTLKTDPFFLGDQRRIICRTYTATLNATRSTAHSGKKNRLSAATQLQGGSR